MSLHLPGKHKVKATAVNNNRPSTKKTTPEPVQPPIDIVKAGKFILALLAAALIAFIYFQIK